MIHKSFGTPVDLEKVRYDLAIEFAKASLQKAISNKTIYTDKVPEGILEMDFLAKEFCSAFGYYANMTDEYWAGLIDNE